MNYLIDTHVLIWYFEDSPNIPTKIINIIDSVTNHKYISSVSLWEIAIKTNIGKLKMSLSFDELLDEIASSDLTVLQVEDDYLKGILTLPFLHKDPFDRLIISTAISENLTIITADENIQKYDTPWLW